MDQGRCRGGSEKWPNSGGILKSVPTGHPDGLEVRTRESGMIPRDFAGTPGKVESLSAG